jgi:hypothetical protein
MLKLDNNLLEELGLGSLPEDQKRSMLQHIYETLELRVGTNLANQMTDQQLEEFEKFIDDGGDANQAQALQWLETNLPNYKQVVNEVFEALKGEIAQMAPQLVTASQQQPAMPQMPQAPQQGIPAYQDQSQFAQPQSQQYAQPPVPPVPQQQATPTEYFQTPQGMQQPQMPQATPQQGGYQPGPQGFQPPQPQFPQQQPPAGPAAQQPPQYPPQQAA